MYTAARTYVRTHARVRTHTDLCTHTRIPSRTQFESLIIYAPTVHMVEQVPEYKSGYVPLPRVPLDRAGTLLALDVFVFC